MHPVKFKNTQQGSGWTPVVPVPAVKSLLFALVGAVPAHGKDEMILDDPSYPNQSGILGWKYQLEKGNIYSVGCGEKGVGNIFQLQCQWGVVLVVTGSTGALQWVKSASTYCWNEPFLGDLSSFPSHPSLSLHPPNSLSSLEPVTCQGMQEQRTPRCSY